jgi:hypothetical protein
MMLLTWLGRPEPERDNALAVFRAFLRNLERLRVPEAGQAGEGRR